MKGNGTTNTIDLPCIFCLKANWAGNIPTCSACLLEWGHYFSYGFNVKGTSWKWKVKKQTINSLRELSDKSILMVMTLARRRLIALIKIDLVKDWYSDAILKEYIEALEIEGRTKIPVEIPMSQDPMESRNKYLQYEAKREKLELSEDDGRRAKNRFKLK